MKSGRDVVFFSMGVLWSPWYNETSNNKVTCKLCNSTFAKKPTRMLSYLGYIPPSGVREKGVSVCPRLTREYRLLFLQCGGKFPLRPSEAENGNEALEEFVHQVSDGGRTSQSTQGDSCTAPSNVLRSNFEVNVEGDASGREGT